jgi:hypothetical protein
MVYFEALTAVCGGLVLIGGVYRDAASAGLQPGPY